MSSPVGAVVAAVVVDGRPTARPGRAGADGEDEGTDATVEPILEAGRGFRGVAPGLAGEAADGADAAVPADAAASADAAPGDAAERADAGRLAGAPDRAVGADGADGADRADPSAGAVRGGIGGRASPGASRREEVRGLGVVGRRAIRPAPLQCRAR
ncbi:hypothetical protein ACTXPT_09515 [Brachybacterium alimentarium]